MTTAPANTGPRPAGGMTIGMIGMGDMGGAIATSLLRNRCDLVVSDLRATEVEKFVLQGARAAGSLEALADECDVALVVVVDDKQVASVVSTLLRHPGRLHSIVVSSTVLPATVLAFEEEAAKRGVSLIDAPVSGGAEKASRGIITVLIGGETAAVDRCRPVFESFGKNIFHVGPLGAGSAAKLVNNLLSIGGNMLHLEAMQLAHAYGISEDSVVEFVTVSAGDSRTLRTWGRIDRARRSHYLFGTPAIYEMFSKDVKNAATAAGLRGVILPIVATIGASMEEKMKVRDAFVEEHDMTAPLPRCGICGQELAAPFRQAGVHPECAYDPDGQSNR
jgi:3-hydroxyisobutyrate dehydrogenase-like beta-hydroxyacid dehydrogenase